MNEEDDDLIKWLERVRAEVPLRFKGARKIYKECECGIFTFTKEAFDRHECRKKPEHSFVLTQDNIIDYILECGRVLDENAPNDDFGTCWKLGDYMVPVWDIDERGWDEYDNSFNSS